MMMSHEARCNLGLCFSRGKMPRSSFSSNCGVAPPSNMRNNHLHVQTRNISALTIRYELLMGCRRTSKD